MTVGPPAPASSSEAHRLAGRLGPIGVWNKSLSGSTASDGRRHVRALEDMGVRALWISEGVLRKEIFAHMGILLAASRELVVASGVANIYARDAYAMANAERALGEAYPERVVLGLGVSHQPRVEERGAEYLAPVATMRDYLARMDAARYAGPNGPAVPRLIGAQGPKMLALAAELTAGAHPYLATVEHTTGARAVLGPDPVLAVEQAVILETDPARARAAARRHLAASLELDNYRRSFRRVGFDDDDMDGGGSDALVDALVGWGDIEALGARVREHLDRGADHVCVQVLADDLDDERTVMFGLLAECAVERTPSPDNPPLARQP